MILPGRNTTVSLEDLPGEVLGELLPLPSVPVSPTPGRWTEKRLLTCTECPQHRPHLPHRDLAFSLPQTQPGTGRHQAGLG